MKRDDKIHTSYTHDKTTTINDIPTYQREKHRKYIRGYVMRYKNKKNSNENACATIMEDFFNVVHCER